MPLHECICNARLKVKGAVAYCKGKRLTKQCLYEKKTKYLVQVEDKVEQLYSVMLIVCFLFFAVCVELYLNIYLHSYTEIWVNKFQYI